jgi:hypothetical protein
MIITGGENGEEVRAVVVLNPGMNVAADALVTHCRGVDRRL